MSRTFKEALRDVAEATGLPIKAIAAGAGVSYEQLKKVMQRDNASTNVDDARKVANYLGFTLDEFLQDELASDRAEVARLYSQLTQVERDFLQAAARGRRD